MRLFLLTKFSLAAAALGLFVQSAVAGPLDTKQVAADAHWLVHVDLDAGRDSQFGKFVRDNCLKDEHAQNQIKKFREDTGVDPTKDLHSLTLYGSKFAKDTGVAIFRASNMDHKKMVAKLKEKHSDVKTHESGESVIYTWTEHHGKMPDRQVSGVFHGDDSVLFSSDEKQLQAALDVLDGKSPSLATDSPLAAAMQAGTSVMIRGIGMSGQATPFHSDVIGKSKELSLALGESGDKVFAQGVLVTADADTATQVRTVVEGLRAMGQLRFHKNETAEGILKGLSIKADGDKVSLDWQASGADVVKMIAEQHEKMKRRRAERQEKEHTKP